MTYAASTLASKRWAPATSSRPRTPQRDGFDPLVVLAAFPRFGRRAPDERGGDLTGRDGVHREPIPWVPEPRRTHEHPNRSLRGVGCDLSVLGGFEPIELVATITPSAPDSIVSSAVAPQPVTTPTTFTTRIRSSPSELVSCIVLGIRIAAWFTITHYPNVDDVVLPDGLGHREYPRLVSHRRTGRAEAKRDSRPISVLPPVTRTTPSSLGPVSGVDERSKKPASDGRRGSASFG